MKWQMARFVNLPVNVNVFFMSKFLLASKTAAEKIRGWAITQFLGERSIEFLLRFRQPNDTATALNNAIIEYMSGFWIGSMRYHTSILLRKLHFLCR